MVVRIAAMVCVARDEHGLFLWAACKHLGGRVSSVEAVEVYANAISFAMEMAESKGLEGYYAIESDAQVVVQYLNAKGTGCSCNAVLLEDVQMLLNGSKMQQLQWVSRAGNGTGRRIAQWSLGCNQFMFWESFLPNFLLDCLIEDDDGS